MTDSYEGLTPLQVEQKLRQLNGELERAVMQLRATRDAEMEAKKAYDKAKRRALLSPECPRVARNAYTVAYRDAWVDEQCEDLLNTFTVATVARQSATDYLTTVRKQVSLVQSLNKSVDTAYRMPDRRWS